jgi:hypothetical protein
MTKNLQSRPTTRVTSSMISCGNKNVILAERYVQTYCLLETSGPLLCAVSWRRRFWAYNGLFEPRPKWLGLAAVRAVLTMECERTCGYSAAVNMLRCILCYFCVRLQQQTDACLTWMLSECCQSLARIGHASQRCSYEYAVGTMRQFVAHLAVHEQSTRPTQTRSGYIDPRSIRLAALINLHA